MSTFEDIFRGLAEGLSEENYDKSFAQYRIWLEIGSAYGHITIKDQLDRDVARIARPNALKEFINPTAHLLIRFIGDVEADQKISRHALGLQRRHCTTVLQRFVRGNLSHVGWKSENRTSFLTTVNFIAHWANLGYVEEVVIRDHILQSLISHPKLYDHQAEALIVLFKLAGTTFETYTDPSVINRCFELLKGQYGYYSANKKVVQEVVDLRERGWEGLPPPPVFAAGELRPAAVNHEDPATTPVITSLGLPNNDLEPRIPQPPLLESITAPDMDTIPTSPATPIIQSPSISIATLSDSMTVDSSDDELPIDPTAIAPHETFYLDDGNVEVLCGNTLFRVHTTVLSFHSPALRRMFAQINLVAAESPNGCPRILSSDAPEDFTTLLKMIYLPGFPERNKVPDFSTFSSLLRITAKYEMPAVRSQILEVVRDAYPETFEGLTPSKPLGESVFGGPAPHPNETLSLFVQQNVVSALPMAYYMAVRRGPDSLMDRRSPASARMSPEILRVAIKGLLALREMELKETHRLILGSNSPHSCRSLNCPSRNTMGPRVSEAHQKVVDRIVESADSGTKLLQVLSVKEVCGGDCFGFCAGCVEGWEVGHADVRKKAWAALPDVFGLKG